MTRPSQEDKYLKAFGKHVADIRKRQGLTQGQVSQGTGLAIDSIAAIEQGRRWVRMTTLHKLANTLKVPIDQLFKNL